MKKIISLLTAGICVTLAWQGSSRAQEGVKEHTLPERSQIKYAFQWRLEDLYPSVKAWEAAEQALRAALPGMQKCKGTLAQGEAQLKGCLQQYYDRRKQMDRLKMYADLVQNQDRRDPLGQELHLRADKLETDVRAALSFVEPEILAIPGERLKRFLSSQELSPFRATIERLVRKRPHVLSPVAEETIARSSDLATLPENVYMTVSTVNAPVPVVTLSDGQSVEVSRTTYMHHRASPIREDRIKVFKAFWGTYQTFRETYAGLVSGVVSRDHYYARVRNYKSDLEASLDRTNVPISIYSNMIKEVRQGLPLLWRYMALRKKLLGLAELGYHDLYTSIVPSISMKFDWDKSRETLLGAMGALGPEYHKVLNQAFVERWFDVYPAQGKAANANTYTGAYEVHPYVLLNHVDDYMSLTMAAHESGRAVHAYLADRNQPIQQAEPPHLVSLVASTVNESLLWRHLHAKEKERSRRLFLLGQYLETWRQTVFRQALFSEFELKLHELAEAGVPLTADRLDKTYLTLLREYYGEAKGVCIIDPLYAVEWAYVTDIYHNFFVYQYTASFIASAALSQKLFTGDKKARAAYQAMLKAGGSRSPTELLAMAGVNLDQPKPYQEAFRSLEKALDEVESLMAQAERQPQEVSHVERSKIDPKYTWDLTHMYKSVAAWEADLKRLNEERTGIAQCKGKLGSSEGELLSCLDRYFAMQQRSALLEGYANRLHDQDAKDVAGQELFERISKVSTLTDAAISFWEPEILGIPPERLAGFMKSERLATYRHYIDNITRRRAHVLSPLEEEIIARAGDLAKLPENVYMTVSTLNVPYPTVTLKDGRMIRMTPSMYTLYRSLPDRADRFNVFQSFWLTYQKYRETYANLLAGVVNRDHYLAVLRKYPSDLHSALDQTNVPTEIYHNMIKQVRAARPLLWRYLKLRKKLLGITELGYHDLYTSIVPALDLNYQYDAAQRTVMEALKPLGPGYQAIMTKAFTERWTDVYPTRNKRSGAYMEGSAYAVHPYVLLNYNDDYESMSTLAHEFGHAGHSYLANTHQKFHNADYPIFTAEVASTLNENLLLEHMLAKEKDRIRKLGLLGEHLESWRGTVFRQALFAEFELKLHEMAQSGIALTADVLDRTYLTLLREYYGEAEGVCKIDPLYAIEWAYIPHLYYNFYMFQYTTSFLASAAIAKKIHQGDAQARDSYLGMLQAGGSRFPVDLLQMAGVDLRTDAPYQAAFAMLKATLDQAEKLVEKR